MSTPAERIFGKDTSGPGKLLLMRGEIHNKANRVAPVGTSREAWATHELAITVIACTVELIRAMERSDASRPGRL